MQVSFNCPRRSISADRTSVTVTSILRMQELKPGSKAIDQTYGTMGSTLWSVIEPNTGILCACLPLLKVPIMAWFPKFFNRSNNASGSGAYHSPHPHPARRPSGMALSNIFSHLFSTLSHKRISHSRSVQQSTPAPNSNTWRHSHRVSRMTRPIKRPNERDQQLEGHHILTIDRETTAPPGAHGSSRSISSRGGLVPHETHEMV